MKRIMFFLLFCCLCQVLSAQEQSLFSISLVPGVNIPFTNAEEGFIMGGGMDIDFDYKLPFFPLLSVCSDICYSYLPLSTGDGCNFLYAGGGLGIHFLTTKTLSAKAYGTAGYYYGIIADNENRSGGNLYAKGGLQFAFALSPVFDLGVNAQYQYVADGAGGALVTGINAGVSSTIKILPSSQLRINEIQYMDIFPVLYKYYNTKSIGTVILRNEGSVPVENLEVSFFIAKYMDNYTLCPGPRTIAGGQDVKVDLFALLAEGVLDITEATLVSGKVMVAYTQDKKKQTVEKAQSIRIYDRNAITWDDDRKVAAYVTYKDPVVIDIAKTIARARSNSGTAIDENLGMGMALHEALKSYGITYVKDPTTPFIEFSKNKLAVDYIQFPRNTLQFKSGDCDDLSILYATLLQAVGIDTAFITIPGHIFMAFALSASPETISTLLTNKNDVIVYDKKAWVPVEITSVTSPFLDAWKIGATEWNESYAKKAATIYPTYESWKTYEPVGYVGMAVNIPFVTQDKIEVVYKTEMNRFVDRELAAKTKEFEASIKDKSKLLNKLGIVNAQYGRYDKAIEHLKNALQIKELFTTLVNLGNVYYLEGDFKNALDFYNKALKLNPDYYPISLQLSRVQNKLGNFEEAAKYFAKLKEQSPETAAQYAYLNTASSDTGRAAEIKEVLTWSEE